MIVKKNKDFLMTNFCVWHISCNVWKGWVVGDAHSVRWWLLLSPLLPFPPCLEKKLHIPTTKNKLAKCQHNLKWSSMKICWICLSGACHEVRISFLSALVLKLSLATSEQSGRIWAYTELFTRTKKGQVKLAFTTVMQYLFSNM